MWLIPCWHISNTFPYRKNLTSVRYSARTILKETSFTIYLNYICLLLIIECCLFHLPIYRTDKCWFSIVHFRVCEWQSTLRRRYKGVPQYNIHMQTSQGYIRHGYGHCQSVHSVTWLCFGRLSAAIGNERQQCLRLHDLLG